MKPESVNLSVPSGVAPVPARRSGRYFYTLAALAIIGIVLLGFSRTYYLRPIFTSEGLSRLLHVHGAVMSLWFLLFLTQSWLVAARRVAIHRQLGQAGAVVGVAVIVVGFLTAIGMARAGRAPGGVPPLVFLTIPLGDLIGFGLLVGLGLWWRRERERHKRLLLLGSLSILPAAIARIPLDWIAAAGPLAYFGLTDLCIVICAAWDGWLKRRVHPVFVIGGVFVVGLQAFRLWFSGTEVWHTIAAWLVS